MIRTRHVVVNRLVESPLAHAGLRRAGVRRGPGLVLLGIPLVSRVPDSEIVLGRGVTLVSSSRWTALGVARPVILRTLLPGSEIHIGAESGLSGATICSARSIRIGERVLLGADVMISDTDFHPLDRIPRHRAAIPAGRPEDAIVIEDDVFIGARSIVMKGVTIGAGSVVGAASVVTRSVPAGTIVAGNPARRIRELADTAELP
ncbi:acyltransferase [uncultured Amnibacterium sp.]|uniref:acyltransferase n=1 Tax=uncultured Amnibacterium sp. TaxID=1631851 RepID=UPI0035CC6FD5